MPGKSRRERVLELVRYYQAGIVNTAFGIGAYSVLVWGGLGIFPAQLISHFMGMGFNYLTYSRHVFREAGPAKARFLVSYIVNYGASVVTLAIVSHFIANPYVSGILSVFIVSLVNFFALKFMVFKVRTP